MPDIKTKDAIKGTIKTIDRSAIVSQRMKNAYISAKEKTNEATESDENSPTEYAANKIEETSEYLGDEAASQFDNIGHRAFNTTKENLSSAKNGLNKFKEKRAAEHIKQQRANYRPEASSYANPEAHSASTAQSSNISFEHGTKNLSTPVEYGIKASKSRSIKYASDSVKASKKASKAAIKTASHTAKTTAKTAQNTAKASYKAMQAMKATARAAAVSLKAAVKATVAAVKAIIAGTKALVAAIAAGGWVAVIVIIVICLVALLLGSVFGIFFSGEDSGSGMTIQTAIQEINAEYEAKLDEEKATIQYDVLEMSGSRAVWKEVLAVYAVKVNTDPNNPQDVATVDDAKTALLSEIFWEMNSISSSNETKTETVLIESDDGHGNIVLTETTLTRTYLYITVTHKTAFEMAAEYNFNQEQLEYLTELLKDSNNSLWSMVLYGITATDDQIVAVALSQVGNIGGEPYWSWYGFESRVDWCACFVSWCANECGYIETGVIPKYAGCVQGVQWFKDRGQWIDGSEEPIPGMIIFFDWNSPDPQDGRPNHTGIVQKVENGLVYSIEGNSADSVRVNSYPVGHFEILGYGVPAY